MKCNREDAKGAKQNAKGWQRMNFYEFRDKDEKRLDDELENLAHSVIGAAIEVHRHLGPGLPENSYRDALSHEFDLRSIPHQREVIVDILYKDKVVGKGQIDILVAGKLIVELKVVEQLISLHRAQLISYLKMTKLHLGLLINFNVEILKSGIKRVINS
jgi:GxxExxY protein